MVKDHSHPWIAFLEEDTEVVEVREPEEEKRGSHSASFGSNSRGSSKTALNKRIKQTIFNHSSSMPVTCEETIEAYPDPAKGSVRRRSPAVLLSSGVDSDYDYLVAPNPAKLSSVSRKDKAMDPPTTHSHYDSHLDNTVSAFCASDVEIEAEDITDPNPVVLIPSRNHTISTSSSSGSSDDPNRIGCKQKHEFEQRSFSTSESVRNATSITLNALENRDSTLPQRGRSASRATIGHRSVQSPSSSKDHESRRTRSLSQARSSRIGSSTSLRSRQQPGSQARTTSSKVPSSTPKQRGRSHSSQNRSSRSRPPPTRSNSYMMERRSRSRSRSDSLSRVVNSPGAGAPESPFSSVASVAARSVPSRLPSTPRSTATGYSMDSSSSSFRGAARSSNRSGRSHRTSRVAEGIHPHPRGASSIGPGVACGTVGNARDDSISGLEFVFAGEERGSVKSGTNVKNKRGKKPTLNHFMGMIFGENSGESKVIRAKESSQIQSEASHEVRPRTLLAATVYHNTATNLWITTINTNQRGVARDPATANQYLKAFSFTSEREAREAAIANAPPKMMTEDESQRQCLLCNNPLGLFRRPAHCRNCGVCVCHGSGCSTTWPSRSVPDTYNLKREGTVRVCAGCDSLSRRFRKALVEGAYEDAVAVYGSGNVNLRTPFPIRSRREEVVHPVHAAAEGGNLDILRWLVEDHYCPVQLVRAGKTTSASGVASSTPISSFLSPVSRNQAPILTSKGRSVLSIAMEGARVSILRYLVIECGISLYNSDNLQNCLRSLEAALLHLPSTSGVLLVGPHASLKARTSHHSQQKQSQSRPLSTRSSSVRFQASDEGKEGSLDDPSIASAGEECDKQSGTNRNPSSGAEVAISVRSSPSRASLRSRKSSTTTKSAPAIGKISGKGMCILCLDRPTDASGISCRHEIACHECRKSLQDCPVCGGPGPDFRSARGSYKRH